MYALRFEFYTFLFLSLQPSGISVPSDVEANSYFRFDASFATFTEFTNDENTRMFLAMEIGAGHIEVCDLPVPCLLRFTI